MASFHSLFLLSSLISLALLQLFVTGETLESNFLRHKKEKLTHFRVYWHDILNGQDPTAVTIINPPKNYTGATGFGMMRMIDNPLTLTPKLSSKMVGRAQGFYAATSKEEIGLLMAMNFAIFDGKYNGSTITVLGRNSVLDKVREMPVIGGSGLFRFARGYVQSQVYLFRGALRGQANSVSSLGSCELWHRRLGHPSLSAFSHLSRFIDSGYQAAKFHGEILNMKQENKRVSTELQSGLDRVRTLKTEVEKILNKLEEDLGISSATEARTTPSKSSSSGRPRIPLRSFLFGVKLKKNRQQKQASASLFSCVSPSPGLHKQSSYSRPPGKLPE